MKLIKHQLSNRLNEVLLNGKWVLGTNLKEQIIYLKWTDAIKRVENLNSIAALTFHIHYYIAGVKRVLEGHPLDIKDKYSFNAPPIQSKKDWDLLVAQFCKDAEQLIQLVNKQTEEKLFSDFIDPKYGNYQRNINVIIEHTYYHLGQIILIKKLLGLKN